ncbi:MAG: triose-phosphate isomerase [Candidatus Kinetoplastibacterium crithidii]|nr:triose-phosphate isomerase [Candidatus Kinetoplastibacterium crithidii]
MGYKKSARLVLGNWKMFGSFFENARLLKGLKSIDDSLYCEIGICIPFPYLYQAVLGLQGSNCSWGAQDISMHSSGAYTGEVSGVMLKEFGCKWVIVGHSERRMFHGETDLNVLRKMEAAINNDITPVVCVGETLEQYKSGISFKIIEKQVSSILELKHSSLSKIVISYEPIWAIGSGIAANPDYAQNIHYMIRKMLSDNGVLNVKILYGGSVKPNNAFDFFSMPDIDGALVGGASLILEDFLAISSIKF